jgi:hypothetical protein
MYSRRSDIPKPSFSSVAEALAGAYEEKTGESAFRELSFRFPVGLFAEVRSFIRRKGPEPLVEVIIKCLQSEVK